MKLKGFHQAKEKRPQAGTPTERTAVSSRSFSRTQPVSACDDLQSLIAKRAYELYAERGYRHGAALDDWLEAEREIVSQIPPV